MQLLRYVLSIVLPLASAIPWNGPEPTQVTNVYDVANGGWSPAPTMEPGALSGGFELKERQLFSYATCGFISGSTSSFRTLRQALFQLIEVQAGPTHVFRKLPAVFWMTLTVYLAVAEHCQRANCPLHVSLIRTLRLVTLLALPIHIFSNGTLSPLAVKFSTDYFKQYCSPLLQSICSFHRKCLCNSVVLLRHALYRHNSSVSCGWVERNCYGQ
jgi:hypothetical protein